MPQGGLKRKVSVPSASRKNKPNKSKGKTKKGARSIAPRKQQLQQSSKIKQTLHKAINKSIEKEVILQAGKNNTGLSYLTKPKSDSSSSKDKKK
jgi:hypothetical protein